MRIPQQCLACIFLLFLQFAAYAQVDTVVAYHIPTQTITLIPPVPVDTTVVFDNTPFDLGPQPQILLSLVPPTTNLFPGTQFNDITRAELSLNVADYPASTAVKLWRWEEDSLMNNCSGTLVGDHFVLTAAHCVYSQMPIQPWVGDSLLVSPAYDNGQFQVQFPSSKVKNCFIFKKFMDGSGWHDIALLELQTPVGQLTGYAGLAFSADTNYFHGKVFHKFSYPGQVDIFDSTRVFNGDTLYYNYGYILSSPPHWLVLPGTAAYGVPGQSGSSFLYTDNQQHYYAMGVFSLTGRYRHYAVTRDVFYQFENIMATHPLEITTAQENRSLLEIFPNPMRTQATIRFSNPRRARHSLRVMDANGKLVREVENIMGDEVVVERENLTAGMYFIQLILGDQCIGRGRFVVMP